MKRSSLPILVCPDLINERFLLPLVVPIPLRHLEDKAKETVVKAKKKEARFETVYEAVSGSNISTPSTGCEITPCQRSRNRIRMFE